MNPMLYLLGIGNSWSVGRNRIEKYYFWVICEQFSGATSLQEVVPAPKMCMHNQHYKGVPFIKQNSRFFNLVSLFCYPSKKNTTFFVRALGLKERSQNVAEVNIMINAIYSSINLYAQLALLAKLRARKSRHSFSAAAFRPSSGTTMVI